MDRAVSTRAFDSPLGGGFAQEHIGVAGALYVAYQFDEMRLFQVIERIAELFRQGLLPIGRGATFEALLQVGRGPRVDASAVRRNAYWRMFGFARGDTPAGEPNSRFAWLWRRFIVAVADRAIAHERSDPQALSEADERVRTAARDLAANLSAHLFKGARAVTEQVTADVQQAMEVLADPSVQRAFGARSAWQVIDRVNASHLGGAVDVARYRKQVAAAHRIFERLGAAGEAPPQDAELAAAVEEWVLANASAHSTDDR